MPRIMIVDDHPITRDGLVTRLAMEPDLEVCCEASNFEEAIEGLTSSPPDVAVIDISLETSNGLQLVKEMKRSHPHIRMLVWSMYDESLYAERALQAGAHGYINKKNVRETIIEAIRTVLSGEIYLSPDYSAKLIGRIASGKSPLTRSPVEALSDRELEAFVLIGQGKKTAEIASTMQLSPNTIETYRSRIKDKLELRHAAELARVATQWVLENA